MVMSKVYFVQVKGPLAAHSNGYRSRLADLGYTPHSIENQIWVMGRLSQWLQVERLDAGDFTQIQVKQFLIHLQERGRKQPLGERKIKPLLDYLRSLGVLPPDTLQGLHADELLERYRYYLAEERRLAPRTLAEYESFARRFVNEQAGLMGSGARFQNIAGVNVNTFLLKEVKRLSVGAAKNRATQLRSLLRFLYLHNLTAVDLAASVPPIAGWCQTRLPVPLTVTQADALLDSCDRSHPAGRRDYAVMLVLARLGLRSAEVAGLQLGDIDWRAGEILIRGKSRRTDRLPLPMDVGEAIVAYLCDGRPHIASRNLFLTLRAPLHGMHRVSVSEVVRNACKRIGIPPAGSHRLRHTLASEMLRCGATLPEIGEVLRHRDLATTAVYAKVDRAALRTVAQPWPGTAL